MKNFYFLKKNFNYYCLTTLAIICGLLVIAISVGFYFSSVFELGCVLLFSLVGILLMFYEPFVIAKAYKRQFTIHDRKLVASGGVDLISVVNGYGADGSNKSVVHSIYIPSVNYIFITKFLYRLGNHIDRETEKIDNKKVICGYMFLLNKFVYDSARCENSWTFEYLNRQDTYKSEFYETLFSTSYQKEILNELFFQGFKGEIYILSSIYMPRKESFDNLFKFYLVAPERIHIVE